MSETQRSSQQHTSHAQHHVPPPNPFLALLFVGGVGGFIWRASGGFADRTAWGYYAAMVMYIFTTFQAAPICAVATRLVKAHWRRPMARAAELCAIVGVFNFFLFLPLLWLIPPLKGRSSLWFDWPLGAPYLFDVLAMGGLALLGLALVWTSALPDFAAARDTLPERRGLYARLSFGWLGTKRRWLVHEWAVIVLGALYLASYVMTSTILSTEFSMSLVPGWRSSVYPAYHTITGLQNGIATTLVILLVLRTVGGYRQYVGLEQFWGLAKLLLALSLLWFYFWWSDFIVHWYGRTPREQNIMLLLMFGPYQIAFFIAWLCSFLIPFICLATNRIRVSVLGPPIVALSPLIGSFFDRIRLYVSAFSIEDPFHHELTQVPPTHLPDGADVLLVVGGVAGAILVYLLATRIVPVLSHWEMQEGILLRAVRPLLRMPALVIGKPR
ncbi:MAG: hypothetical protein HYU88_00925 [Chloroflexi bacterium]|nr:hypothetical protein [Chloroflexota bacterium]